MCKTQYQFSRKIVVKYIVEWIDENGQAKSRDSLSSAGAAGSLFLKVSLKINLIICLLLGLFIKKTIKFFFY